MIDSSANEGEGGVEELGVSEVVVVIGDDGVDESLLLLGPGSGTIELAMKQ